MTWFIIGALMFAMTSCAGPTPKANHARHVAVAVSMTDGKVPTPTQLASIHRALAPEIAARSLTIVQNSEAADYVLAVRFAPDGLTPDGGRVTIIGIQRYSGRRGPSQSERLKAEADAVHERMSIPTP